MPPIDFFLSIVDTLAKRYGWSFSEISENMYWEDVYELYEYACNLDTLEKNDRMKFEFMLHAGSKEAINKWRDMPIPFPDRDWKPKERRQEPLPASMASKKNTRKMTDRQRARADYVKRKVEESNRKADEALRNYYS